tara:strand:- start:31 stop:621 length:591 start_codon:yes stop_codon:yes gene_type:complete
LEEIIVDNSITDEELVTLIVNNKSSQLFSVIYDRYSHVVYNKCISFVKDTNEAQDLTHDIFVKLFIKLKTFNHKSKFSTWLYSFTYNHCVNYVQRDLNKRKDKFLTTEDINDFSEVYPEIKDEFIYELKSDSLQKSLELMDPNDKMILFMKYQDDMTIEDIQKTLEIGKSAVKMRLSRAKSRLIKIYKTFYYGKSV